MKEGLRKRLTESIEAASQLGEGLVEVELLDGGGEASRVTNGDEVPGAKVLSGPSAGRRGEVLLFSGGSPVFPAARPCPSSSRGSSPSTRRTGAVSAATGSVSAGDRPGPQSSTPTLSISEGALEPWTKAASMYHRRLLEAVAEANGIDIEVPWRDLPESARELLLEGTGDQRHTVSYRNRFGRRRKYTVRFDGMLHNLQRRYENTDSENTRERVEALMALQPCQPAVARGCGPRASR